MPEQQFPVKLSQAQRRALAELFPAFRGRLKLDECNQRMISFTLRELQEIAWKSKTAVRNFDNGMTRNSLQHVSDIAIQAIDDFQGIGSIPVSLRIYQFKITLKEIQPSIWRRIQVRDCTLDKFHGHIQLATGWTNSHLHHFQIGDQKYGDPDLMEENFAEFNYENSLDTMLSQVLPKTGKRFRFEYEYDFGDGWWHSVLFEGCLRAETGTRYPICVEGARACPPEDVGGTGGYEQFVEIIADPDQEEHDEWLTWSGPFDPEAFDPVKATKKMRRGLPDWRKKAWI